MTVGGAELWDREVKSSGETQGGGGDYVEKKRRCNEAQVEEGIKIQLFRG